MASVSVSNTCASAKTLSAHDAAGPASGLGQPSRGLTRRISVSPKLSIARAALRSEEHTSALQSLMRISHAVFCLKKRKRIRQDTEGITHCVRIGSKTINQSALMQTTQPM